MQALTTPRYTAAEAGRLTGFRPERVRRWLRGYAYHYPVSDGGPKTLVHQQPVIQRDGVEYDRYASFLELIDLIFVRSFLDHGLSLQKIRAALAESEKIIGGHHFAQQVYFTDGHKIYLKLDARKEENLLELMSGGQWVISEVIRKEATQIDFDDDTGFAEKWYPEGRDKGIVLDPKINFGAPTIVGKGIRTSNIYDLFVAESGNTEQVSNWMNLEKSEVKAAVDFEAVLVA